VVDGTQLAVLGWSPAAAECPEGCAPAIEAAVRAA
jgi:hypothetical protein